MNEYTFAKQKYRPVNVGFGLSYALPVVASLLLAKPGGLVIIENPEAHIHPKGQSYLGRLIALCSQAGVQVIIETHSEHIINGIRVTARLSDKYCEGQYKVFFIAKDAENNTIVEDLPIGVKGDLVSWPKGFFDQQAMDIKTLIKGSEAIG
jgi:predicted ATPase